MKYYLYNSLDIKKLKYYIPEDCKLIDTSKIRYKDFFDSLNSSDEIVLIGGDMSINYLINLVDIDHLQNNVYLLNDGTSNDFLTDIGGQVDKEILINDYLKNLPTVKVNGMTKKFVNNMGFGIDGYCCEAAEENKIRRPNEETNYTMIAIIGFLFRFRPFHADIEVDGNSYSFDNVWMAPTMKGKYFGGGMKVAPDQDRKSDHLTVVVLSSKSKLKALMSFPTIFEGKHIEKTDLFTIITGKKVHAKFSRPAAGELDGNVIEDVSEYWVKM